MTPSLGRARRPFAEAAQLGGHEADHRGHQADEVRRAGGIAAGHARILIAGAAEVTGAVGLILPAATRIQPVLTPIAASGLIIVMVLAAGFELTHGRNGVAPLILGTLAAFVAWGRFKKAPVSPRA